MKVAGALRGAQHCADPEGAAVRSGVDPGIWSCGHGAGSELFGSEGPSLPHWWLGQHALRP